MRVLGVLKWVVGVSLTTALIAGGVAVFLAPQAREWMSTSRAGDFSVYVKTEPAEPGRLVKTVSAPGEIEPRKHVQISSRISAQILELPFDEGDRVEQDDLVVKLDDADLRASFQSAMANLRASEARLEGSKASHRDAISDLERTQSLFETKDVSEDELENARAELDRIKADLNAAEQNVEAARAEVARIREELRFAEIRSPMDGVITRLNAEVGEVVVTGTMNNAGTVILEIADLSEMLVLTEVDENDIAPVREGQSARVYINAFPDEVFEGVVRKIALQHDVADDGSKYFETEVLLYLKENRQIFSGLTANVDIEVQTLEDVITVPSQAVKSVRVEALPPAIVQAPTVDQEKTFTQVVFTIEDEKAQAIPVNVGPSDLRSTAILAGLEPGTDVITGPWSALERLRHGQAVTTERRPDTTRASRGGGGGGRGRRGGIRFGG